MNLARKYTGRTFHYEGEWWLATRQSDTRLPTIVPMDTHHMFRGDRLDMTWPEVAALIEASEAKRDAWYAADCPPRLSVAACHALAVESARQSTRERT